jgi:hypothetical protein
MQSYLGISSSHLAKLASCHVWRQDGFPATHCSLSQKATNFPLAKNCLAMNVGEIKRHTFLHQIEIVTYEACRRSQPGYCSWYQLFIPVSKLV